MLTLLEARSSSRLGRIAGTCPSSSDFVDLLNDAVRMLMNRGDFYGTVQKICACVYGGLVTWPRQVSTVLAINKCNGPVSMHNHWFQFNRVERQDLLGYWASGCCGGINGIQGNTSPVFNPIACKTGQQGAYIRFYPTQASDVGKIITVFGEDSNGQTLRSQYPDGTFQDGIQVVLALPYGQLQIVPPSSNVPTIRHITRIIKDVTNGPVRGYQYDPINDGPGDILRDLAYYEASETLPDYQTTQIGAGCGGCCPSQICALVKLNFVPVVNDNDLVLIENLDAIATMMQALKLGDSYDVKQKQAMETDAVRELNLELRRRLPLDQIMVEMSPFGTGLPRYHSIGRIQ